MSLSDLIAAVIAKKTGNQEFALFYMSPGWTAEIGNPVTCVCLGESEGEYRGEGATPEQAVQSLLEKLP